MTNPRPVAERFWEKVDRRGADECWPWLAFRHEGYGQFQTGKRTHVRAHRMAWELTHGPITGGLHVDHLCRNPACCNPAHLEPVTRGTNLLRGDGPAGRNSRKTHCVHGHPFDEANTRVRRNGHRVCIECHRRRKGPPERRRPFQPKRAHGSVAKLLTSTDR